MTTTNPTAMLESYARGEADLADVCRSLVRHDGYLVSVDMLVGHYGQALPATSLNAGSFGEYPPNELWVFTDEAAARHAEAEGSRLGPLATGVKGQLLFNAINPGWNFIRINPVSVAERTWNFPTTAFPLLQAWVKAIELEEHLSMAHSSITGYDALFAKYPHFTVYVLDDDTILTMPNQGHMKNPAVVVTAPDAGRNILSVVPEEMRQRLRPIETTGAELIQKLPSQGVDGLLVNPAGPGPTYAIVFNDLPGEVRT